MRHLQHALVYLLLVCLLGGQLPVAHAVATTPLGTQFGPPVQSVAPTDQPARRPAESSASPQRQAPPASLSARAEIAPAVAQSIGRQPLEFVANAGQTDASVRFTARTGNSTVFFTPDALVFAIATPTQAAAGTPPVPAPGPDIGRRARSGPAYPPTVTRLRFVGARQTPQIDGTDRLPGVVNYFLGNDSRAWRTNIPTYGGLSYAALYDGIALHYEGVDKRLKSTYTLAPGADPRQIRWRYEGASAVRVDGTGNLNVVLPPPASTLTATIGLSSTLVEQAPVAWQESNGQRTPVAVRYVVAADKSVSFDVGAYDAGKPLIIDPTISFSTYLGGSDKDIGSDIAVNNTTGYIYVTGSTASTNFPNNPSIVPQSGLGCGGTSCSDAFVTKYDANGTRLFSTYLGGSEPDQGNGIALDSQGDVYVTGETLSGDFPVKSGAYQIACLNSNGITCGNDDAFIVKILANGSMPYSTYLGGADNESGHDIAVDGNGNVYVTGETNSLNFASPKAAQSVFCNGATQCNGTDVFVSKLSPQLNSRAFTEFYSDLHTRWGQGLS